MTKNQSTFCKIKQNNSFIIIDGRYFVIVIGLRAVGNLEEPEGGIRNLEYGI